MKRLLGIFFFVMVNAAALIVAVSCANNSPNSAFVSPVKTISANNPTWSPTPTPTFTMTPTATPAFPVSGFNSPYALAIVPTSGGVEYVGDSTSNGLIRQYNAGILDSWPNGKVKSSGLSYPSPKAIAADSNGNVYVVGGNAGVYKYLASGDFSAQYNTTVGISGSLGVACSSATLFVSDTNNQQIVQFPLSGGPAAIYLSSLTYQPRGLAVNSGATTLYVAGSDNNVHIYSGSNWSSSTTIPGFNNPYAVAVDSSYDVFVSDTGNHQIEEFTVGNYSQAPASIYGAGTLSSPEGIATDLSGNVYVVDSGTNDFYEFVP